MNFTTRDRDNDPWYGNCAIDHYGHNAPTGGWWYKTCHDIQVNVCISRGKQLSSTESGTLSPS